MTSPKCRVLVVDDQDLMRSGTAMLLGSAPGIVVVGEATNGDDAVLRARELRPDVVVMDVQMPGMDGIEATRQIARTSPDVRVLVMTTFDLDAYAFGALAAGASGFLLKDCAAAELIRAVHVVAQGDAVVAPRATRRLLEMTRGRLLAGAPPTADSAWSRLSDRELDVVDCIARGDSNREIAGRLFISEATVKTHVANVIRKLGVRDRVHVVIEAQRSGYLDRR